MADVYGVSWWSDALYVSFPVAAWHMELQPIDFPFASPCNDRPEPISQVFPNMSMYVDDVNVVDPIDKLRILEVI